MPEFELPELLEPLEPLEAEPPELPPLEAPPLEPPAEPPLEEPEDCDEPPLTCCWLLPGVAAALLLFAYWLFIASICDFMETISAASFALCVVSWLFCDSSFSRFAVPSSRNCCSSACLSLAASAACCAASACLSASAFNWVILVSMALRRCLRFIDVFNSFAASEAAFASLRVTAASDCILLTNSSVVVALVTTSSTSEASEPWKLSLASCATAALASS